MQNVRGTQDFYGKEAKKFLYVLDKIKDIALRNSFSYLHLPIMESANLFERNLGEESDIISKEIYKFYDRSENLIALRPEFTASTVRSFLSNNELRRSSLPLRLFSYGSIFRYDRPQKNRYREFNQFNFEIIGADGMCYDVEMIKLSKAIIDSFDLIYKNYDIKINWLGSDESKKSYSEYLVTYFEKYKSELSDESQRRLGNKNPIRILDSKDPKDIKIKDGIKSFSSFSSKNDMDYWEKLKYTLDKLSIKYIEDGSLVRGMDYYNGLVFEFCLKNHNNEEEAVVMGGGRYDNMISQISDAKVSAKSIGIGIGIERIMNYVNYDNKDYKSKIAVIADPFDSIVGFKILDVLNGGDVVKISMFNDQNINKKISKAIDLGYNKIIIIENYDGNNVCRIRDILNKSSNIYDIDLCISAELLKLI
jgi:histidyl-tRNA synthetase